MLATLVTIPTAQWCPLFLPTLLSVSFCDSCPFVAVSFASSVCVPFLAKRIYVRRVWRICSLASNCLAVTEDLCIFLAHPHRAVFAHLMVSLQKITCKVLSAIIKADLADSEHLFSVWQSSSSERQLCENHRPLPSVLKPPIYNQPPLFADLAETSAKCTAGKDSAGALKILIAYYIYFVNKLKVLFIIFFWLNL